jgi:hypothetical protein
MSDTPRTDAATRMAFSGEYMVPIHDAQKLERELAEVTKQRDALAFSIRFALANSLADSKSETVLRQALAATKGGIDE